MSLQAPQPTALARAPITPADLLLLLIVNLGIMRIAGLLIGGMLGFAQGGREGAGNETAVLISTLLLILFQALVMLGSLRALILQKYGLTWADLGFRPAPRIWYRRAVMVGVAMIPAVLMINAAVPKLIQEPFENPQIMALAPAGFSWFALIGMTLMGGIVAPIAEEAAFRGLVYAWLRGRMAFPAAALLSAVCFACLHGVVVLIPALTAVGFVLAWVKERCDSILPAIVTHGTFNIVMILSLYLALSIGAGKA